jgi:(2Fe-2S) ferredoxin
MKIAERKSDSKLTSLVVCINRRLSMDMPSCAARGSLARAEALERGVAERRIDVKVERMRCLGLCDVGPNLRLVPGGSFFSRVGAEDVPEVLDYLEKACGLRPESPQEEPLPPPGT